MRASGHDSQKGNRRICPEKSTKKMVKKEASPDVERRERNKGENGEKEKRRKGDEKKKNIPEPAAASATEEWKTQEGRACGEIALDGDASACAQRGRICCTTTNPLTQERVRRKKY
jgi:hypothetical protein